MRTSLAVAVAAWVAGALLLASCGGGQPTSKQSSSPKGGDSLYVANCQACHGDRSGAGATLGAPAHNEAGHTWHHPDAQLKEWVLQGRLFGGMPAFSDKLSEEDVEAILAYIKTWWTEGQRQSQADVSRRYQEALDKQKKER